MPKLSKRMQDKLCIIYLASNQISDILWKLEKFKAVKLYTQKQRPFIQPHSLKISEYFQQRVKDQSEDNLCHLSTYRLLNTMKLKYYKHTNVSLIQTSFCCSSSTNLTYEMRDLFLFWVNLLKIIASYRPAIFLPCNFKNVVNQINK